MPNYKLTYFDLEGYGEPIRYMLSILGEDFEDKRMAREEWAVIKPTTPFGKVPMLEFDGRKVCQTLAICRFLGKKAKLVGHDDLENLQIDMAVDCYNDMRQAARECWRENNEEAKAEKLDLLKKETFPFYLGKFDDLVKKNGGYLANGKLSWADIYFVSTVGSLKMMTGEDSIDKYENLKSLKERVQSLPQIKKWIDSRAKASS